MKNREEMRQELLEYHFGVHEDPERIQALLKRDPEARELHEEVLQTADLLSRAARVPEVAVELPGLLPDRKPADPPTRSPRVSWGALRIAAAILIAIFGAVPGAVWGFQAWQAHRAEGEVMRLLVTGPSGLPDAAPGRVRIETWSLGGEPVDAELSWRLLDEQGRPLAEGRRACEGSLDLDLPPRMEGGRSLEVAALAGDRREVTTLELAPGTDNPLVHLSTDKPAYRPGETVFLRGLFLDRLSLAPREGQYRLRVVDGKGVEQIGSSFQTQQGVAASTWPIPPNAVGGEYAFEVRDGADEFAVERQTFLVRRYQPPRLKKELDLDRETYAPGAHGSAELAVERAEGGIPAGAVVEATLLVDGEETWRESGALDAEGRAVFAFEVPATVERGEARLLARVTDGGIVETALEPFVIPTGAVEVDFYPEGGDLVAGVANRVYAQVSDPLGRPISARGRVVDDRGREVAPFETLHQGRARFEIAPERGRAYRLELDEPAASPVELPGAAPSGVAIRSPRDSTPPGEALELEVFTPSRGPWVLGAFCRGVLVAQDAFTGAGSREIALGLPEHVAGVLRVTVFDRDLLPVAERLVQRESAREVRIELEPERERLAPGEPQVLRLTTRDETGEPVPAVVGLCVTDRAVRDMLPDEHRVGLADRTWLLGDVEELEDLPEFTAGDEESRRNVDLLLGTRGWRRFAWVDPGAFVAEHGDEARRRLVLEGHAQRPQVRDTLEEHRGLVAQTRREARDARGMALVAWTALTILLAGLLVGGWLLRRVLPENPVWRVGFASAVLFLLAVTAGALLHDGFREPAVALSRQWAAGDDMMATGEVASLEPTSGAEPVLLNDGAAGEEMTLGVPRAPETIYVVRDGDMSGLSVVDLNGFGGAEGVPSFDFTYSTFDNAEFPEVRGAFQYDLDAGLIVAAEMHDFLAPRQALESLGYLGGDLADGGLRSMFIFNSSGWMHIREYAHSRRADAASGSERRDFAETIYWNALLATDSEGSARVEFSTSDSVTTWSVVADAHGAGRVGQAEGSFEARLPFRMDARVPVELTLGDRVQIPVAFVLEEGEATEAEVVALALSGERRLADPISERVELVDGRGRILLPFEVGADWEGARLELAGRAGRWSDSVRRGLRVVPRGFPHRVSRAGRLPGELDLVLPVPADVAPGSLTCVLKVYPSPLSALTDGMEGMLREPHGCFEQTSSSNYPNVLALAYLEGVDADEPALARRARGMLETGYGRLAGYECPRDGFEWWGDDPGHGALSAYGLLQFTDMARVYPVDDEMLDRTRSWLLGRRDGEGGFLPEGSSHSFGRAPVEVSNAYLTWSLAETGTEADRIAKELAAVEARVPTVEDAYELAVGACALEAAGRLEAAELARERLKDLRRADGSLVGSSRSITSSTGVNLAVETTSFAILAWLSDEEDAAFVEEALAWLLEQRRGDGTFGATQATIMALRALVAHAEAERPVTSPGRLIVYLNGNHVDEIPFGATRRQPIVIDHLSEGLRAGDNHLHLELTGENDFPFALDFGYHADRPADDPQAPVAIEARLARPEVEEGDALPLHVEVANSSDEDQGMVVAIIGLPAGLEIRKEVLDDLLEAERFAFWEQRGRELVLYWRGLAAGEVREVDLDLLAVLPGETEGPASRAYPYYSPDAVRWHPPLRVEVSPAAR